MLKSQLTIVRLPLWAGISTLIALSLSLAPLEKAHAQGCSSQISAGINPNVPAAHTNDVIIWNVSGTAGVGVCGLTNVVEWATTPDNLTQLVITNGVLNNGDGASSFCVSCPPTNPP